MCYLRFEIKRLLGKFDSKYDYLHLSKITEMKQLTYSLKKQRKFISIYH
jgi:hypothetical protein